MITPAVAPWPFFGRAVEFETVMSAVRSGIGSKRGAVVIADAGVGKTHLLRRVGQRIAADRLRHPTNLEKATEGR